MAKAKTRLTKASVLAEIRILRERIAYLTRISDQELREEYIKGSPGVKPEVLDYISNIEIIRSLLFSATYHMTNVLCSE